MNQRKWLILAAACAACIDWTRLAGKVKAVNLKAATVTLQTRDGDLFTVPVDYQLSITNKNGELKGLKQLQLDDKVTITRVPAEPPKEDAESLAQPEPSQHGL